VKLDTSSEGYAEPPMTATRGMVAIRGALRPGRETLREPTGTMSSISATAATTRTGIAGLRMTRTLPSVAIARAEHQYRQHEVGGQTPQHAAEHKPVELAPVQVGNDHVGADRADHLQRSHTTLDGDDVEAAALECVLQEPAALAVSLGNHGAQTPLEARGPGFAPGTGGGAGRLAPVADGAPTRDHRRCHGEPAPCPPVCSA